MGGEWSKAVKIIFNKKYSNGRGKLVDAMKDPETKAIHSSMLGKKPMKMETKMNKTKKFKKKKMGGGDDPTVDTIRQLIKDKLVGKEEKVVNEAIAGIEQILTAADAGPGAGSTTDAGAGSTTDAGAGSTTDAGAGSTTDAGAGSTTDAEAEAEGAEAEGEAAKPEPKPPIGGSKSKKNRSNKKDKKRKSFRKKCGW